MYAVDRRSAPRPWRLREGRQEDLDLPRQLVHVVVDLPDPPDPFAFPRQFTRTASSGISWIMSAIRMISRAACPRAAPATGDARGR